MGAFKHKQAEWLSRQQAAERLIDIAYALTAGGPLELSGPGRRVAVPVPDELGLERELKSTGDQVQLELELRWSTAGPTAASTDVSATRITRIA
jgi:amphi-Trp domain-containing protein